MTSYVGVGNALLAPLHSCGRKWNSFSEKEGLINKISQFVQKIFLSLATILAFIPAIPGSIIKRASDKDKNSEISFIETDPTLLDFFNNVIKEEDNRISSRNIIDTRLSNIEKGMVSAIFIHNSSFDNSTEEGKKCKIISLYLSSGPIFLSYIRDCFSQTLPKNPEQIKKLVHLLFSNTKLTKEQQSFLQDFLRFTKTVNIEIPNDPSSQKIKVVLNNIS
jgi:hypothetical protein